MDAAAGAILDAEQPQALSCVSIVLMTRVQAEASPHPRAHCRRQDLLSWLRVAGKTESKSAHDLLVKEFEADALKISKYDPFRGQETCKEPPENQVQLPQKRNLTISITCPP